MKDDEAKRLREHVAAVIDWRERRDAEEAQRAAPFAEKRVRIWTRMSAPASIGLDGLLWGDLTTGRDHRLAGRVNRWIYHRMGPWFKANPAPKPEDTPADMLASAVLGEGRLVRDQYSDASLSKEYFELLSRARAFTPLCPSIDADPRVGRINDNPESGLGDLWQWCRVVVAKLASTGVDERVDDEPPDIMTPGPDFETFQWGTETFEFAKGMQRRAVACLWEARTKGRRGVMIEPLRTAVGSSNTAKPADWFRDHPAWKTMVMTPRQGFYTLADPKPPS